MLRTESYPPAVSRVWSLAQRFQRFLVVGVIGLAVNQGVLMLLAGEFSLALLLASPIAIVLSMIVTFLLNETWTWQDRGAGRLINRALLYGAINSGGLLINTGVLFYLTRPPNDSHYLLANLIGAGVAAIWNFGLNHAITWRQEA